MSVRELVDAYEPVIRRMHKAVDLSSTLSDFENFLKDLIKLGRIHTDHKSHKPVVPTVGDFVQLLRKHQRSCHVFMHQCAKNDEELTGWYFDWAKKAASQFKQDSANAHKHSDTVKHGRGGAGSLTPALHELFSSLDQETQSRIKPVLDSHSEYLDEMHAQSLSRLEGVLKSPPSKNPAIAKIFSSSSHHSSGSRPSSRTSSPAPSLDRSSLLNNHNSSNTGSGATTPIPTPTSSTFPANATSSVTENSSDTRENPPTAPEVSSNPGPGAFLARWQALLDATPITSLTQHGAPKAASSPEVVQSSATDVDGSRLVEFAHREARGDKIRVEDANSGKDVQSQDLGHQAKKRQKELRVVVDALGQEFRDLLARQGCYW